MANHRKSREERIQQIKSIHGDLYGLDMLPDTITSETKVKFICKKHGVFVKQIGDMVRKNRKCGCPKCSYENLFIGREAWLDYYNKRHNFFYCYDLAKEITNDAVIPIICPKHGIFYQQAEKHKVAGCSKCRRSRGEAITAYILQKHNVTFLEQHRFPDCKGKRNTLPFDFYIPSTNTAIEYNGKQHYNGFWLDKYNEVKTSLETIQTRDNIKKEYCLKNNIRLIVIRYDQDVYEVLVKEGVI
jgi:hypothetical protein